MSITQSASRLLAGIVLALVLAGSAAFMLYGAWHDSAIMDELAHIPAGYGYVHNLDYRLNPEHPPLVKALAAFPLLFLNLNYPTNDKAWAIDVNGQWDMGRAFLYGSGNNADEILHVARLGPILITLLLVLFVYLWTKKLLGRWWGLLPAFFTAFSPTILAHGHYVTTDVGAAFGVVIATYYFLEFLLAPSKKKLVIAGVAFGIAELLKFSTVLLAPYFLLLLVGLYVIRTSRDPNRSWKTALLRAWKYLRAIIVFFVIGYVLIVYPVYALFTVHYPIEKQASDTQFILSSYAGGPAPAGQLCHVKRCLADLDIWMSKSRLLRPFAQYFLGILMVLQRSAGGNTNYFLGMVSSNGWHYYFPTVYALKEPIPVLIFVFLAALLGIFAWLRSMKSRTVKFAAWLRDHIETHCTEYSLLLFVAIYWGWSMNSPLNIGFRHLLPTLPLIYILATIAWKSWITDIRFTPQESLASAFRAVSRSLIGVSAKYALLIVLIFWFFMETAFAAPHLLSYFNEFAGGTWNGYRFVTDSNYDWGQDMLRLRDFVAAHPEIDKIGVDYFGGGDPHYYLGDKEENWWSSRGNPADQGIHWLAVSINSLEGATGNPVKGYERNPEDGYSWLVKLRPPAPGMGQVPPPDYRVGTSIFVYHL